MDLAEALQRHAEGNLSAFDIDSEEVNDGDEILAIAETNRGANLVLDGMMITVERVEGGIVTAGKCERLRYDSDRGPAERGAVEPIGGGENEVNLDRLGHTVYALFLMPRPPSTANRWTADRAAQGTHLQD